MNSRHTPLQSLYFSETIRRLEASARHEPLMQRAGAAIAAWAPVLMNGSRPNSILIIAGPGNNGGDAIEAARLLLQRGIDVHTVFYGQSDRLPIDAATVHQRYLAEGGILLSAIPTSKNWGLIIDGLFGIGLTRDLDNTASSWVAQINTLRHRSHCPVLAVDCPSGLGADTGRIRGSAVRATHTLTFLGLKPGLFTLDGPDHCGEIRLATLEVNASADADGHLITPAAFSAHLQPRLLNTHKGSFGRAYIIGGSQGMLGAAFLAARAALKLGAGRVYAGLLTSDTNKPQIDFMQPELMLHSAEELLALPETANALLCGPGLGQSETAQALLARVAQIDRPLVLDADALNILARDESLASMLKKRLAITLLTPHPAEAARLLAWPITRIQDDRFAAVREIARRYKVCVALKGCGTLIADTQQRWQINRSGNPALATAGSGDVLSGFIVALLAQGWPGLAALTAAVHLHGLAAESWSRQTGGTVGMSAGEIIEPARTIYNMWLSEHGN